MSEPKRVAASEALQLRLRWRQAWPAREADYVVETDSDVGSVGRIYVHGDGPQKGVWLWAVQADGHEISRKVGEFHSAERPPAPLRRWSRMPGSRRS